MSGKSVSKAFHYKLHGRHDEISLHISRAEAIKLIQGIRCKLKQRQSKGHREYFILHAHKARIWHRLTVTHHSASRRHGAARLDAVHAQKPWVTA
jgi:hypothetical protein